MAILNDGKLVKTLPLMEAFYTIQGEGFYAGLPAYFIRLGGCDVGCHWCDVKESWDAGLHPDVTLDSIVDAIPNEAKFSVVTGGEPLMYDLFPLTAALKGKNLQTHIETSGAYPLTGNWDWICLSPKKNKLPVFDVYQKANELKVIIYNRHDFVFAEEQALLVNATTALFLQPEWSKHEEIMPLIIDYVKQHPKWRISLQTHKYLGIP